MTGRKLVRYYYSDSATSKKLQFYVNAADADRIRLVKRRGGEPVLMLFATSKRVARRLEREIEPGGGGETMNTTTWHDEGAYIDAWSHQLSFAEDGK